MHKAVKRRNIKRLVSPEITKDGAGVTLRRAIGTRSLSEIDPFLLFDHFGSDDPDDYIAGFPMHPHRGIETVTYMLAGRIRHRDSVGNSGVIESGGIQWMTAGAGIMHEEMPEMTSGRLEGFQLWVNLRAAEKMSPPSYQEFDSDSVPVVSDADGNEVRIIAGSFNGVEGAVRGISGSPVYLDVKARGSEDFRVAVGSGASVFVYVYRGSIESADRVYAESPVLVTFDSEGEEILVRTGTSGASFIVIGGDPIGEPIARYGPFVMNTQEEIRTALTELRNGTFIRNGGGE